MQGVEQQKTMDGAKQEQTPMHRGAPPEDGIFLRTLQWLEAATDPRGDGKRTKDDRTQIVQRGWTVPGEEGCRLTYWGANRNAER